MSESESCSSRSLHSAKAYTVHTQRCFENRAYGFDPTFKTQGLPTQPQEDDRESETGPQSLSNREQTAEDNEKQICGEGRRREGRVKKKEGTRRRREEGGVG
ncbi:unnamed protein product [Pleuronectes platessa]|uniref:Uncharacterized protein n=1 Tax=Pleuronectes platessa TaxID=8262 RepID=A0A9N7VHV4_PLEPL|nr:unnamed protein product [Pleuronectes platessa]